VRPLCDFVSLVAIVVKCATNDSLWGFEECTLSSGIYLDRYLVIYLGIDQGELTRVPYC
jgi:hypothetical protein